MRRWLLALALLAALAQPGEAQQLRTLTWDPSPEAGLVLEYHVFKNRVYHGATNTLTYVLSLLPGETVELIVRSYGYVRDALGNVTTATAEGVDSNVVTYTEPAPPPPPPPTTSTDGAMCNVFGVGCPLIDAGVNVWTISSPSWAILRNGSHWNGGYSDWLLWFGGSIYAYRSDLNAWWVDTATGWSAYPYDPRTPPPPPPPPPVLTCHTLGLTYQAGATETWQVKATSTSSFVAARRNEGWGGLDDASGPAVVRPRNRSQDLVTMRCYGR